MQTVPVTGVKVPYTVVEEYEIVLEDGVPRGCTRDTLKCWTPRSKLGWRFAIARDDNHFQPDGDGSDLDVFFDTCAWQYDKGDARIGVSRSTREQTDEFRWEWSDVAEGVTRILSFSRNSVPAKPMIRFAVTGLVQPSASATKPRSEPLWAALNVALKTTRFSDTLFYAFSTRAEGGGACEPRSVAANARVLKMHCDYFLNLLGNEFQEKDDTGLQSIAEYDYESDSDLEGWDDPEEDEAEKVPEETAKIEEAEPAEEEGNDSDDGGMMMLDSLFSEDPEPPSDVVEKPPEAQDVPAPTVEIPDSPPPSPTIPSNPADVKRVLLVRDMAFTTWQALVFYLYTGHVGFVPLRSGGLPARRAFLAKYTKDYKDRPAPCSPKSMFRLADKLGLKSLEDTALEALQAHINDDNVVDEFFTAFTNKYDRVQAFYLEYLRQHSKSKTVQDALARKSEEARDRYPDLLFAAFKKLIV